MGKKKWSESILIALLVALATLISNGTVLAVVDRVTISDQDLGALDQMEWERNVVLESNLINYQTRSQTRYEHYLWALQQVKMGRSTVLEFAAVQADDDSWFRYQQYLEYAR